MVFIPWDSKNTRESECHEEMTARSPQAAPVPTLSSLFGQHIFCLFRGYLVLCHAFSTPRVFSEERQPYKLMTQKPFRSPHCVPELTQLTLPGSLAEKSPAHSQGRPKQMLSLRMGGGHTTEFPTTWEFPRVSLSQQLPRDKAGPSLAELGSGQEAF